MPIKLFQARQILLKLETVEGIAEVLSGATNALLTFQGSVQVESDKLEREIDAAFFHANPFVLINRRVTVQFDIEMLGAATQGTAAPISPVLRAAAMSETLVATVPGPPIVPGSASYKPRTDGIESATVHFNHGGVLFKASGCKANIEWEIAIDNYAKGKVTLTGLVELSDLPAAAAAVAVTLTAFRTPPAISAANWTVLLNGVAVECTKISLNHGADVQIHHHSESRVARVMDRKPSGSITIYLPDLAVLNPYSIAANHTDVALSSVIDGGAGKKISLLAGVVQIEEPKVTEINKGIGLEIPLVPKPTNGNDEYNWLFE